MKFILIFTLATIVNCLSEYDDLDRMTRTRRVERIDDQQFQETAGDYSRIKNGENHEDMKYRRERQYDYEYEEYYDEDESYENEHDSSSSEEEGSALKKLRKLLQNKPDAIISAKLYNFSYCVTDEKTGSRKGPVGRFADFDNLLSSVFPEHFSNDKKRINLYYIVFSAEGQRLFDTKGRCAFTFKSLNKRKVINERTNLVTTDENAILDVQGKEKLRLKFLLGNKQEAIRNRDGSNTIFFDPELRITYNCFMYSVLAIACPERLSSEKTMMIRRHFSKLMSSPIDVEKFIEAHSDLPDYKISTQEISTGAKDEVIFDMFKPYIKETQKDTVQIGLCKAAGALYHHTTKEAAIHNYIYGDVQIPESGFFNVRDTARPPMRRIFNQALEILKDKADRISKGGDIGRIRNSLMKCLKRLFQEHRRLTGNYEKFHEFENHFGAFKRSIKQKYTDNQRHLLKIILDIL